MSMRKTIKKNRVKSLPFDCWSRVIEFFGDKKCFQCLVLSVKGLLSFVRDVCPSCTQNIVYELLRYPTGQRKEVTNVDICVHSSQVEDQMSEVPPGSLKTERMEFCEILKKVNLHFPSLMKLKLTHYDIPSQSKKDSVSNIVVLPNLISLKISTTLTHIRFSNMLTSKLNSLEVFYELSDYKKKFSDCEINWNCFPSLIDLSFYSVRLCSDLIRNLKTLRLQKVKIKEDSFKNLENLKTVLFEPVCFQDFEYFMKSVEGFVNLQVLRIIDKVITKGSEIMKVSDIQPSISFTNLPKLFSFFFESEKWDRKKHNVKIHNHVITSRIQGITIKDLTTMELFKARNIKFEGSSIEGISIVRTPIKNLKVEGCSMLEIDEFSLSRLEYAKIYYTPVLGFKKFCERINFKNLRNLMLWDVSEYLISKIENVVLECISSEQIESIYCYCDDVIFNKISNCPNLGSLITSFTTNANISDLPVLEVIGIIGKYHQRSSPRSDNNLEITVFDNDLTLKNFFNRLRENCICENNHTLILKNVNFEELPIQVEDAGHIKNLDIFSCNGIIFDGKGKSELEEVDAEMQGQSQNGSIVLRNHPLVKIVTARFNLLTFSVFEVCNCEKLEELNLLGSDYIPTKIDPKSKKKRNDTKIVLKDLKCCETFTLDSNIFEVCSSFLIHSPSVFIKKLYYIMRISNRKVGKEHFKIDKEQFQYLECIFVSVDANQFNEEEGREYHTPLFIASNYEENNLMIILDGVECEEYTFIGKVTKDLDLNKVSLEYREKNNSSNILFKGTLEDFLHSYDDFEEFEDGYGNLDLLF